MNFPLNIVALKRKNTTDICNKFDLYQIVWHFAIAEKNLFFSQCSVKQNLPGLGSPGRLIPLCCSYGTENTVPVLQGPVPTAFQVCTHQVYDPVPNVVLGMTEQLAVPAAQPACSAVYQVWINAVPDELLTHK